LQKRPALLREGKSGFSPYRTLTWQSYLRTMQAWAGGRRLFGMSSGQGFCSSMINGPYTRKIRVIYWCLLNHSILHSCHWYGKAWLFVLTVSVAITGLNWGISMLGAVIRCDGRITLLPLWWMCHMEAICQGSVQDISNGSYIASTCSAMGALQPWILENGHANNQETCHGHLSALGQLCANAYCSKLYGMHTLFLDTKTICQAQQFSLAASS